MLDMHVAHLIWKDGKQNLMWFRLTFHGKQIFNGDINNVDEIATLASGFVCIIKWKSATEIKAGKNQNVLKLK